MHDCVYACRSAGAIIIHTHFVQYTQNFFFKQPPLGGVPEPKHLCLSSSESSCKKMYLQPGLTPKTDFVSLKILFCRHGLNLKFQTLVLSRDSKAFISLEIRKIVHKSDL